MRRSRRYSAIEASRQIFNGNTTSSSSDSETDSDHCDEDYEDEDVRSSTYGDWQFLNSGDDIFELPESFPTPTETGLCHSAARTVSDTENNIDFFLEQFLSNDLYEMLCKWTNRKAELSFEQADIEPNGDLPETISNWRPVTTSEMKKLLGIIICMSFNRKPEIRNYWSRSILYKSDFFQDSRCLSRNRFTDIMKFLRFCDYDQITDDNDSLRKIRPFLEYVQNKCKSVYIPQKNICVDESLLLYKGRLHFRRYIPSKRARYGILSYCLCESSTGYTWNIQIASGREDTARLLQNAPENTESFTFSEKIVIILAEDLLDRGYHLYIDNFFASVRLSSYLFTRKTLMTGTIRPFRGVPQILREKVVQPKSTAFCRKAEILCVKSVDRKSSGIKTIYLVDTANKAISSDRTRILRGGVLDEVSKSQSVLSYNKGMGGIDMRDGSLHSYNIACKSFKWFTKLSLHLIHVMVRNSWIAYRSCGGRFDFLKYQENVVDILVMQSGEGRRARSLGGRTPKVSLNQISKSIHAPKRLSPTPNKQRPAKRCKICSKEGKRKETVFFCPECPESPALCVDPCFRKFHDF